MLDKHRVSAFPIHEYWLDVGEPDTFERAHYEWENNPPNRFGCVANKVISVDVCVLMAELKQRITPFCTTNCTPIIKPNTKPKIFTIRNLKIRRIVLIAGRRVLHRCQ